MAWLRARVLECSLDATTEIAVAPGDPRHQILVAADAFESDLIVVGRRGVDGAAGTEIGGVARAALRPTTRAVLVIPPAHVARLVTPIATRRHLALRVVTSHPIST